MQNSIRLSNKTINNLKCIPTDPGIYCFLDTEKQVIYIGKAKNLRKRVKSYFPKSKAQSKKLKRLISESIFLEITITNSELEALLLEQHLIKWPLMRCLSCLLRLLLINEYLMDFVCDI